MGYFDLSNESGDLATASSAAEMPLWEQVLLYLTVFVAVVFSKGVAQARAGQAITLDLNWIWLGIAALIALIVFPAVWKSLGSRADAPILVRMGVAAQGGAFWAILVTAAEKAATPA
jgi:hypothetical protein